MMKTGILTFPNSPSYGAALQMYALYTACSDLGYDTEIINYHNLWMKQEKHTTMSGGRNQAVVRMKRALRTLLHIRMKTRFARFEGQLHKYPRKAFSEKEKLGRTGERYGAVICGSDQVWNPDITHADMSYFLDFCGRQTARISYAPSFGVEQVSEELGEQISQELEKFNSLSVREDAGRKIIEELTGKKAALVVDPTLLLDADRWQLCEKAHPLAKGDYILYYTVRSSKSLWSHCLALSRKTRLKILRIGSNVISKHFKRAEGVEYVCDAGPAQWLYLVRNAAYVVTNSFHGTAFSINFRKNFYVEFSSLTNSRLTQIISALGLEERVVSDGMEIVPSPADYRRTEEVLPAVKAESLAFLEQALQSACGGDQE